MFARLSLHKVVLLAGLPEHLFYSLPASAYGYANFIKNTRSLIFTEPKLTCNGYIDTKHIFARHYVA